MVKHMAVYKATLVTWGWGGVVFEVACNFGRRRLRSVCLGTVSIWIMVEGDDKVNSWEYEGSRGGQSRIIC